MINILKKIIIICIFFYLPFTSNAWGLLGHRIVGQIAESYLTPTAKKAISKILGTESLAMAANWADFIKSDTTMSYISKWHYVDVNGGMSNAEFQAYLKADTIADAYTKLNFLIKELKNKQLSHDKKVMYLRLLIHIVGDIHQPLHVGHPDDEGGNKIKVTWLGTPTNLHSVWDSRLIDFQQLSYTEYTDAINHTTAALRTALQKQTLSDWFFQTYEVAQKVYSDIKPDDKLSFQYNYHYIDIVNQQLVRGGVHLAGLLNSIFGVKTK